MKLTLKNIGKFEHASIEINAVTVIAGENNSGKTTIGKALYSVINGLPKNEAFVREIRMYGIFNALRDFYRNANRGGISDVEIKKQAIEIIDNADKFKNNQKEITAHLTSLLSVPLSDNIKNLSLNLCSNLTHRTLNASSDELATKMIWHVVVGEFGFDAINVNSYIDAAEIELKHGRLDIVLSMKERIGDLMNYTLSLDGEDFLNMESFYIDNPYLLDDGNFLRTFDNFNSSPLNKYITHQHHLLKCLVESHEAEAINEIFTNEKLGLIFAVLNEVGAGELNFDGIHLNYKDSDLKTSIGVGNVSTGLKTFAIIKTLLKKRQLNSGDVLILDEPEKHLHPEWQLVLAELIVLIQKEFEIKVLLTTHSPYFLQAMEVYETKHGIFDKCKFYLTKNEGTVATLTDVTGDTEKIYKGMAKPLQILANERAAANE